MSSVRIVDYWPAVSPDPDSVEWSERWDLEVDGVAWVLYRTSTWLSTSSHWSTGVVEFTIPPADPPVDGDELVALTERLDELHCEVWRRTAFIVRDQIAAALAADAARTESRATTSTHAGTEPSLPVRGGHPTEPRNGTDLGDPGTPTVEAGNR